MSRYVFLRDRSVACEGPYGQHASELIAAVDDEGGGEAERERCLHLTVEEEDGGALEAIEQKLRQGRLCS